MPATSSVPPLVFTPGGVVAPSSADILAGALADTNAAFGGKMNTADLETPQGQLASSLSAIVEDKNADILEVVAGVDPAFSSGRFQDALGRIYFMDRQPATPTIVTVTASGAPNTPIPAGSLA